MAKISAYLLILLFIKLPSSNSQQCYFPNGSLASGHRPCNLTATHSACCNADNPQALTTASQVAYAGVVAMDSHGEIHAPTQAGKTVLVRRTALTVSILP